MTATTDHIHLKAYLDRIGYAGPLEPTPTLLEAFVQCHIAAIPFENINVLLGRGVDLAPSAVDRKLLIDHRGGYCFEHASLMRRALEAVGFDVRQYLGRVWVKGFDRPAPPATHAALKVEKDNQSWLVDVGFGGFLPNRPLRWRLDTPQSTDYGEYRLSETRVGYLLESLYKDQWSPLYELLDFHWQAVDFKVANHYTATHPDSRFRRRLQVARTERTARTTLADNRLKRVSIDGVRDEIVLDAAGLADALARHFGLPVATDWEPLLEMVVESADTPSG